jgi:hypothetical protein
VRELADPGFGAVSELDHIEYPIRVSVRLPRGKSLQTPIETKQIADGRMRIELAILGKESNPAFVVLRLEWTESEDIDTTCIGSDHATDDPKAGRLAGSVRAHHSRQRTGWHLKVETVERRDLAVSFRDAR